MRSPRSYIYILILKVRDFALLNDLTCRMYRMPYQVYSRGRGLDSAPMLAPLSLLMLICRLAPSFDTKSIASISPLQASAYLVLGFSLSRPASGFYFDLFAEPLPRSHLSRPIWMAYQWRCVSLQLSSWPNSMAPHASEFQHSLHLPLMQCSATYFCPVEEITT